MSALPLSHPRLLFFICSLMGSTGPTVWISEICKLLFILKWMIQSQHEIISHSGSDIRSLCVSPRTHVFCSHLYSLIVLNKMKWPHSGLQTCWQLAVPGRNDPQAPHLHASSRYPHRDVSPVPFLTPSPVKPQFCSGSLRSLT